MVMRRIKRTVKEANHSPPLKAAKGGENHSDGARTGRRIVRRGMASMEAVLLAGIGVPIAVMLLYLSFRMCQYVYQAIAHTVGWPYL